KNGKKSIGQKIQVTETSHPDNELNLLTDIFVTPNNMDDSRALNSRIDHLKTKTPDLIEHHIDGAYGSTDNDKKCEKNRIDPVQTGIRGKIAGVDIEITRSDKEKYHVCCSHQKATVHKKWEHYIAVFDESQCMKCPKLNKCPVKNTSLGRSFNFIHEDYLRQKRLKAREKLPSERKRLRNNVEATIHEFSFRMPNRKLKVRGRFKTALFAYAVGISINFGRIFRYLTSPDTNQTLLKIYFKELIGAIVDSFYNFWKSLLPVSYKLSNDPIT
ncbi:MAG: transposase, partial [Spirochaetes bacterium]|nr:transposase [Spirochaetota bacterium]